jgi:hypothetical protein
MQSLAIGIQTAFRPRSLLLKTLRSIREAGFSETIHVFAEPMERPQLVDSCEWLPSDHPLGCFPNWKRGVHHLLTHTNASWILMLQDDHVWRPGAADILKDAFSPHPTVGFLSPYTSPKMVPHYQREKVREPDHWQEATFHDNAFVGALAICMPRESANALLAHPRFQKHDSHRKVDVLVGNVFRVELRLPILVHVPSLVDHTGNEWSTLGRHKIPSIQWGRRGLLFDEGRDVASNHRAHGHAGFPPADGSMELGQLESPDSSR